MTHTIGFIGGPGIGKDTIASGLLHKIKSMNIDCFLANEYVKPFAYLNNFPPPRQTYENQLFIEEAALGKTDFIISLSPILLVLFYSPEVLTEKEKEYILSKWARPDHTLYFIKRSKPYIKKGRYQTKEEAEQVDRDVIDILEKHGVIFKMINYDDSIIETLLTKHLTNQI